MHERVGTHSVLLRYAENEIGTLVDAAALDPSAWDAVIAELAQRLPGTKAVFQVVDRNSGECAPMKLAGWDPAVTQSYARYYSAMNPWSPIMVEAPEQNILYSEDLLPASAFRNTEFYADWLSRAEGIDASTGMKIIDSDGRLGVIALHYDTRTAERTNAAAAAVLRLLAPRFRRALDVNKACFSSERHVPSMTGLLDAIADPAFLITSDYRLQAANASAREILDSGSLLKIGAQDRLVFVDRDFADHFRCHVADALAFSSEMVGPRTHIRSNGLKRRCYSVFATLLSQKAIGTAGLDLLFASRPSILVLLKRNSAVLADTVGLFRRLGLTPAEIRLALRLDGSRPLAAIAAEIGIGYETARTQRRSAYAKLGISRHAELIALMLQMTSGA